MSRRPRPAQARKQDRADWRQTATTLAGILSVLLVAAGLLYTNAANRAQQELTERGQVTDRISKAIDQIGSEKLDVRLGGMYALERLMRESPGDQPNLVAVLCAYVRVHATSPRGVTSPAPAEDDMVQAATDVQTALTILARRPAVREREELDLSRADLRGAELTHARLAGANLSRADLSGAVLIHADLSGANLIGATVNDALLVHADLRGAVLIDTNLADAVLEHAKLADTDLMAATGLTTSQAKCADFNDGTMFPGVIKRPPPGAAQDHDCRRVTLLPPR